MTSPLMWLISWFPYNGSNCSLSLLKQKEFKGLIPDRIQKPPIAIIPTAPRIAKVPSPIRDLLSVQ